MYDPEVVDAFIVMIGREAATVPEPTSSKSALGLISSATSEKLELGRLFQDLQRAATPDAIASSLLRHLRPLMPAVTLGLYRQGKEPDTLAIVASSGVGASMLSGLELALGEGISGWAFAHRQVVLNSAAKLDLGALVEPLSDLRYTLAVPVLDEAANAIAVLTVYGTDPFDKDHLRILGSVAGFLATFIPRLVHAEIRLDEPGTNPSHYIH
jgi:hypothetical protein